MPSWVIPGGALLAAARAAVSTLPGVTGRSAVGSARGLSAFCTALVARMWARSSVACWKSEPCSLHGAECMCLNGYLY